MTSTTLLLSKSGLKVGLRRTGQGVPLVLLHGVGLQSAAWGPQIAALAPDFEVIAIDLPGHGGSDRLTRGAVLPDYVAWCGDVLRDLDVGPVNLAGHSMGALIAGGHAAQDFGDVQRVALLNGVFRRDPQARASVEARAATIRKGEIDHAAPLDRWFGTNGDHAVARAQVAGWLGAVDTGGYADAYSAFATGDDTYAAALARISCPFLVMTGTDDLNSTPAMSHAMAAKVPNGTTQIIKGHGHMMNLTAPDQVTAHLCAWLRMPAGVQVAS